MMQLIEIPFVDIKERIKIAFDGDDDLVIFYDKALNLKSTNEMVNTTFYKLEEYYSSFSESKILPFSVDLNGVSIGYVFLLKNPDLLVSFSINKLHRTKNKLIGLFSMIKSFFDNGFSCLLYNENTRAINWLKKCGMNVVLVNNEFTKLKN